MATRKDFWYWFTVIVAIFVLTMDPLLALWAYRTPNPPRLRAAKCEGCVAIRAALSSMGA